MFLPAGVESAHPHAELADCLGSVLEPSSMDPCTRQQAYGTIPNKDNPHTTEFKTARKYSYQQRFVLLWYRLYLGSGICSKGFLRTSCSKPYSCVWTQASVPAHPSQTKCCSNWGDPIQHAVLDLLRQLSSALRNTA